MFDTFVMVDWSAATVPRSGRDSIWICWHAPDGERLANPPTRHAAKGLLGEWLAVATARGERVLLGFDFPFGYPQGFAARLRLPGPPWRAIWDEIARLIKDDENNDNNRFDVAAAFNERVSGGPFPFWGCPAAPPRACLGSKHHRSHEQNGLAERRLIDEYMRGAQPCWKLLGAGSVGGQVLTGLPIVRALRDDPRWRDRARIWPCETGLRPPEDGTIVMAEVYPSLWAVSPVAGEPKDAAQVRVVARFFAERDRASGNRRATPARLGGRSEPGRRPSQRPAASNTAVRRACTRRSAAVRPIRSARGCGDAWAPGNPSEAVPGSPRTETWSPISARSSRRRHQSGCWRCARRR